MRANKQIRMTTIIGKNAECAGDFSAQGSARIDGIIKGNVTVSEALLIGVPGSVDGDGSAKAVIIGGEVIGNVTAPERAELTATAKVIGDISTAVIVIDEKAVFQGKCEMNQEVPGKRQKPAAKAVRAGKKSAKAAIQEALKEVEEASREEISSEPQNTESEQNTI